MFLRRESSDDRTAIFAIHAAAFAQSDGLVAPEAHLVDGLRDGWAAECVDQVAIRCVRLGAPRPTCWVVVVRGAGGLRGKGDRSPVTASVG